MTHEEVLKTLDRLEGRIGVLDTVLGETTKTLEDLAAWSSRVEAVQKSVDGSLAALRADIATLEERLEALERGEGLPFKPEVGKKAWAIDNREGGEGRRVCVTILRLMNRERMALVESYPGATFVVKMERLSPCS